MTPFYQKNGITIMLGKAEEVISTIPAPIFGTLVMDPPFSVTPENISPFLKVLKTGGRALILGKGSYSLIPHVGPEADCVLMPEIAAHRDIYHPVSRPVRAMKLLLALTQGSILDPFMGAGSTLVAASELKRECYGIEIEEGWCRAAVERLDAIK